MNHPTHKKFTSLLSAMIKDEKKAPKEYKKLMKSTPHLADRRKMQHIIMQERKHYRILHEIKEHGH